ncbi:MAG: hypothetical protein Ta2A_08980 [Treponemataceae bacterium]|nr:MAG: hypothetical protein Ta2A_08980 [Treponemataceae bacterium]
MAFDSTITVGNLLTAFAMALSLIIFVMGLNFASKANRDDIKDLKKGISEIKQSIQELQKTVNTIDKNTAVLEERTNKTFASMARA